MLLQNESCTSQLALNRTQGLDVDLVSAKSVPRYPHKAMQKHINIVKYITKCHKLNTFQNSLVVRLTSR